MIPAIHQTGYPLHVMPVQQRSAASLVLPWLTDFWTVAAAHAIAHASSVVFGPAIAAVSLGAVGWRAFSKRIGRNA
jgi:hypothetical protein